MRRKLFHAVVLGLCMMGFHGCATMMAEKVGPTSIQQAQEEIPEAQLLDVGILPFGSDLMTEEDAKKKGTHPDIRKAEGHFMAYHLKNTLQGSSHWGAVRTIPGQSPGSELVVQGKILESNGEELIVKVEVLDARGKTWLSKAYEAEVEENAYSGLELGQKDVFQDLYNAIANDVADFKKNLNPEEIREIRTVAKLRFAADFAPDPFAEYLAEDKKEGFRITKLPADNDPMMVRLLKIRNRDHMYLDILNQHYDWFYNEMWPAYENWRKANLVERQALRKMKRSAYMRQAAGALMMALAIALGAGDVDNTQALQNVLIIGGAATLGSGINISRQAEIHSAAIKELSESFGSEMKPVFMELEGQEVELTGSAEEQYQRWRDLLHKIYYAETGFDPAPQEADQPEGETTPQE